MITEFNKTYKRLLNELQGNWDDEYNKDPLEWRKKHGNKEDWTDMDLKKWGWRKNPKSNKKSKDDTNIEKPKKDDWTDMDLKKWGWRKMLRANMKPEEHDTYELFLDKLKYKKLKNSKNNLYVAYNDGDVEYDDSDHHGSGNIYRIGDKDLNQVFFIFEENGPDIIFNIHDTIKQIDEYNLTKVSKRIYPAIVEAWVDYINEFSEPNSIFVYKLVEIDYPKIFEKIKEVSDISIGWKEYPKTYIVDVGLEEEPV